MEIRQIKINQIDEVYNLICEQFGEEAWNKEQLKSSFKSNSTKFYGIFHNQRLICFSCILETLDDVNILYIATRQEYKRQGFAKKMMSFLINKLKENQTLSVEVKSKNACAIKLYESFNFKTLNIRKKYYKDGDDALCMFFIAEKKF